MYYIQKIKKLAYFLIFYVILLLLLKFTLYFLSSYKYTKNYITNLKNKNKKKLKSYLSLAKGKFKTNFVPWFKLLSTAISSFNKSQSLFTIDKPNPVPLISG